MALQEPEINEDEWYAVKDQFSVKKQVSRSHQQFHITQGESSNDSVVISFAGVSSFTTGEEPISREITLDEFSALQRQIAELYPTLLETNVNLELPQPPRGLMSLITSMHIPEQFFVDAEEYFYQLSDHCGIDNVLHVFLQLAYDYEEQWGDLNRTFYASEWKSALKEYEEVVAKRIKSVFTSMEELHSYYEEEDEAYFFLDRKEKRHYEYQSKPFEDLCSVVLDKRNDAVARLSDVHLPVTELAQAMQEQTQCQEHYLEARTQLQQIQLEHYQALAERMELRLKRTEEDKQCLASVWDRRGDGRIIQLHDALNGAIVSMLQLHCQQLADQKEQALLSMAVVKEGPDMAQEVAQKEDEVFRIQLQYLNLQQRLLEEEETKLKYKMNYVTQEHKEKVKRKLNRIPAKIAQMRIKQRECRTMLEERSKRIINIEESISAQLAFQMKKQFLKQDERKRQQEFQASRQKTIHRLKEYQERYTSPQRLPPPRYQPPSMRGGQKKKTTSKRVAAHDPLMPSMRTLEIASLVVKRQEQPQAPPIPPPPPDVDPYTRQFITDTNLTSLLPSSLDVPAPLAPAPPPPPPPPPPVPAPPPPPPAIVATVEDKVETKKTKQATETSKSPLRAEITADIILGAKQRLRKSATTENKGLSTDGADFLRQKIKEKFTNTFSENHDDSNDSSDGEDNWEDN